MNSWKALEADVHRQYGKFSLLLLFKGGIKSRTLRPLITLRLCQACKNIKIIGKLILPVSKVLHHVTTHRAMIDLNWQTKVGGGVLIAHGWGLVINQHATIGRNVTLFHGVTLGQRDRIAPDGNRETEYPVIEDEVWIGPHAIIVGGITIGRGSRIAGGAFVTENVPPYSIVSGNPSKIIKHDCKHDVINPVPY